MSKMIMLIGVPGSGKSTWTRNFLKKNPNYIVISSDDILERYAQIEGLTYSQSFNKYAKKATQIMFKRAKEAFEGNQNVIWDQTNMNVKTRKKKLDMVPEHYDMQAVVFSISDSELDRRLKHREETEGKVIPPHVIKNMASSYQAPTSDEGFSKVYVQK